MEFRCGTNGESAMIYPLAIIHDGIVKGRYIETKEFLPFQDFVKRGNN